MSAGETRPSAALRAGRRALESIEGVRMLGDLRFHAPTRRFSLRLRISIVEAQDQASIPLVSDWFVLIDPGYPLGSINVHPAREGGLRGTFPHQALNRVQAREIPWLSGSLCLETPERLPLGRLAPTQEPWHPDLRLRWYVMRAREWLEAAAGGTLLRQGDPFELPGGLSGTEEAPTLVFSEDQRSFLAWRGVQERVGWATLVDVAGKHFVVADFHGVDGRLITAARWGYALSEEALQRVRAFWVRLDRPPTLPPWQAPRTFGGLRRAAREQGIDVDLMLRRIERELRGHGPSVLLLGFPIPKRVEDPPEEMHWQAFELPQLGPPKSPRPRRALPRLRGYLHGFRDNEQGRWQQAREGGLADKQRLRWLKSENWHSDRIGARGRFMEQVRLSKIAIIGAGALGSLISELLVRGGAEDILLVDDDTLSAGNLVRHRLHMDALGEKKAEALAEQLNVCSPHAHVTALNAKLSWDPRVAEEQLAGRRIILDCTGEDGLLETLAQMSSTEARAFFSISVGREARRLYFFSAHAPAFPRAAHHTQMAPWLVADWQGVETRDLPWEGAGCWHPVWTAKLDDLMLLAATAVKLLESAMSAPESTPRLQVFEQWTSSDEAFGGLRRAVTPAREESHE